MAMGTHGNITIKKRSAVGLEVERDRQLRRPLQVLRRRHQIAGAQRARRRPLPPELCKTRSGRIPAALPRRCVRTTPSSAPRSAGWRTRDLRWLEIVFHGPHGRWDGQMPARLRRSMRAGLRACVCRNAMVRKVNVS